MSEKLTLKSLCICSLFCGILCVFSQISFAVPFGVNFTLQTFAIAFLSYLLPLKLSLLTVGGYILLGAVGLPVFSNFSGGVGTLLGNTGGFIFGFFVLTFFCSYFKNKSTIISLLLSLLGVVIFFDQHYEKLRARFHLMRLFVVLYESFNNAEGMVEVQNPATPVRKKHLRKQVLFSTK